MLDLKPVKISIVTINRNNAPGLARTLKSTFGAQSGFDDWEQIVVDGASTDGSDSVLEEWKANPHLGWHVSEPDAGIYNAMNKGAAHATGEWLLFLNSGDTLLPGVLKRAATELAGADVVYGDVVRMLNGVRCPYRPIEERDLSKELFLFSNIPHQAVFVRRAVHETRGGYDETFKILADWKFWLGCISDGLKFKRIRIEISVFEMGGTSNNPAFAKTAREEKERLLSPVFGSETAHRAANPPEEKTWIRGRVANDAMEDPAFAKTLRRSSDVVWGLWKFLPTRFLLRMTTCALDGIAALHRKRHPGA